MRYDCVALIVAAGRGERAGGETPKQFASLLGVPLVARAVDAFASMPVPMPVFVVVGEGQHAMLTNALGSREIAGVVTGGATRRASVANGLRAIAAAGGTRRVLVHDAARPFVPAAVIDRLLIALDTHDGAIPVLPLADTLVRYDRAMGEVVPRGDLFRVQTPQAFAFDALAAAHENWPDAAEATDDAQMVRANGGSVTIVGGDARLDKITYRADFAQREAQLMHTMISRSATGFDVHRLEPGLPLWLCGVRVEHSHGLAGHSDADVALHALTDALLGTIGAGDIGMHFPPSDPRWRGAASPQFAEHALSLIAARGGIVDHVDVTILCEAPRIGPHRDAMRARLSEILRLPLARISLKATTTERLGFTGRGEGIAAQAIATVRLPEAM